MAISRHFHQKMLCRLRHTTAKERSRTQPTSILTTRWRIFLQAALSIYSMPHWRPMQSSKNSAGFMKLLWQQLLVLSLVMEAIHSRRSGFIILKAYPLPGALMSRMLGLVVMAETMGFVSHAQQNRMQGRFPLRLAKHTQVDAEEMVGLQKTQARE